MTGRPCTCTCGTCQKCKQREYARRWRANLSTEERRAIVARRDIKKSRQWDRDRYQRDKAKRRAAMAAYMQTPEGKAAKQRAQAAYQERDPQRYQAHYTLTNAVRDRRIERQPCAVCGATDRVQGHHNDYSKPLDVVWLCRDHHALAHNALPTL